MQFTYFPLTLQCFTTLSTTNIDYVIIYLEFTSLTKVHKKPTCEYLQDIKYEIKLNSATLNSNLDVQNHGHLGLLITP